QAHDHPFRTQELTSGARHGHADRDHAEPEERGAGDRTEPADDRRREPFANPVRDPGQEDPPGQRSEPYADDQREGRSPPTCDMDTEPGKDGRKREDRRWIAERQRQYRDEFLSAFQISTLQISLPLWGRVREGALERKRPDHRVRDPADETDPA